MTKATSELVERLAREAGMLTNGGAQGPSSLVFTAGFHGVSLGQLERLIALVAGECANLCYDKERRKWEILTGGGRLEGFGPLDCAAAIRERFGIEEG